MGNITEFFRKAQKLAGTQEPARLPRLLHIEDNAVDRQVTARMLDGSYDVIQAGTLLQGLLLARENRENGTPFDLVLLDLGLPDAEPIEALKAVREALPQTGVVVLTGNPQHRVAAKALGVQGYVNKGYQEDLDEPYLKQVLEAALVRRI